MNYKGLVFDLDGTLLNTIEDLADSANSVLREKGFPIHGADEYVNFVGRGLRNLVREALPGEMQIDTVIDECLEMMNIEYSKGWAVKTRPYKGIPELLDELVHRSVKLTVLSNKRHEFTKIMVSSFFPDVHFHAVLGARPSVPIKPDPAGALEISGILGIPPEKFLYLGDSGIDMKTAADAGMFAVGALWGYRERGELLKNGAGALVSKPGEILNLL